MTSALKKAAGHILSSAELYRKLTGPQKICLWLVVGVVGLSFLFVFFSGEQAVGVPVAGEPAARAGQSGPEGSAAGWPFGSSILESPSRFDARLWDINRQRIELAILWNPKIETATVVCSQARSPKYASAPSAGGTAAVAIKLKPGVPPLERSEAEAIRSMVSCALNIDPADVSVTDSEYKSYVGSSSQNLPADVGEAEERWRREIKEIVSEYCSRFLKPSEFHVAVIVYLSPEQTSVEKKEVDPAKTFSKPTGSEWEREETRGDEDVAGGMISPRESQRTVTREKIEEKPYVTWEKRLTKIPPGAIKGVGVIVSLDLGAVKGILSRDPRFAEALAGLAAPGGGPDSPPAGEFDKCLSDCISSYAIEQEEALASLLHPLEGVSVRVMAQPFSQPQPGGAAALPPPPVAAVQPAPAPGSAWGKALLVSAATLSILVFIAGALWMARRRAAPASGKGAGGMPGIPAPGGGPEWVSRDGIREALASFHQRMGRASSTDGPQETLLRAVSETAGKVRRRPDLAASVLRIWLAQDAGTFRERTVRS